MKPCKCGAVALLLLFFFGADDLEAESSLQLSRIGSGFSRPVYAAMAPGETGRMFVVEQHTGRIEILNVSDGTVEAEPFLDLSRLSTGDEQGLLGLAFDPNYQQNGHFYVNFTETSGATNVQRFTVSENPNIADVDSQLPIIRFSQPQGNHNGGWIDFGPNDGYLYIATGDGGAADDNGNGHTNGTGNAQDLTANFLGKMLRIDVAGDAFPTDDQRNYQIPTTNPFVNDPADDEIWAYGLRNPWRNSFDRANGDLYMGDVGQNAREEVSFQPANSTGGENYGWRLREGTIRTPGVGGDEPTDHVPPIHEYPHNNGPDGGFSITGGYVYRGPVKQLDGAYFFADFVSNQIWSIRYDGTETTDLTNWTDSITTNAGSVTGISSFAEDAEANVYIISLDGDIFRIEDVAELTPIVAAGSVWKYLDDGSNQQTAWIAPDFNDDAWKEGTAQLGYGDNDETDTTEIEFGPDSNNKFRTTYFRHEFDISDVDSFESLQLGLLYDDGAAVYLNGTEIARANLDVGANYDDFATGARSGVDEDAFAPFDVDLALLVTGTNVLAVEVHQTSASSSDLSFDLKLNAILRELFGDFNLDGSVDAADIDLLTQAIVGNDQSALFDGNRDGVIDLDDRRMLVQSTLRTWFGDSNLDGEFNSSDLVRVFQSAKYEDGVEDNTSWLEGDWNGDLDFTSTDLVFAFQDGGFEVGQRVAVQSVPEPVGTLGMLLIWLTVFIKAVQPKSE